MQDANNYYEVSNFDWGAGTPTAPDDAAAVKKVRRRIVGGQSTLHNRVFARGNTYNIKITFSPTQVTWTGSDQVNAEHRRYDGHLRRHVQVETGQQDAYYDNILL